MRRAGAWVLALVSAQWVLLFVWARWWRSDAAVPVSILEWLSPAACAASMVGVVLGSIACRTGITTLAVRHFGRRWWLPLGAVVLLSSSARVALVPATERLYYDEHTYLQLARGIADEARAQVVSYGLIRNGRFHCEIGSYTHWSLAWPTALAAGLRATGNARWTGNALNLAISMAAVILVAMTGASLFRGTRVWLAAAAIYAALPANQVWSRTSVSEVFAGFAAVLAVLAALLFCEAPNWRSGCLLAAAAALAVQTRNEMLIVLPVCALFIVRIGGWASAQRAIWPAAAATGLLLPQAMHLGHISRSYDPNLAAGAGFSLRYVSTNLASALQYVRGEWVVLACLVLAVVGLSRARMGNAALPVWLWGLACFLAPVAHFGGSYAFPGGERFALAWLPALSLAAGCGLYAVHRTVEPRLPPWAPPVGWTVLYVGVLVCAGPHAAREDRRMAVPRGDMAFLRNALSSVPRDGVIVSSDPPAVIAEGRSTAFLTWAAGDTSRLSALAVAHPGSLYYFVSPSSSPEQWPDGPACHQRVMSLFRAQPVARESSEAGTRVLYRLSSPL